MLSQKTIYYIIFIYKNKKYIMGTFISKFDTTAELAAFSGTSDCLKPHVSLTKDDMQVHFFELETRVVAKYNVTTTSNPTKIVNDTNVFSAIEIDGVVQPSVVSAYTFSTTGEHTVKYTLTDPTSIGYGAFDNCSSLTSVTIPNSVTSIYEEAFYNCSGLTSCTIGSGVTSIGMFAFSYCSGLTSIDIPDSVTNIGDSAFMHCSGLTSCTIGSGVTSIGVYAFLDCSGLESITSNATTAPTIQSATFRDVKTGGTLTVPQGSSGYDVWMGTGNFYLGYYNWTKVEQ